MCSPASQIKKTVDFPMYALDLLPFIKSSGATATATASAAASASGSSAEGTELSPTRRLTSYGRYTFP